MNIEKENQRHENIINQIESATNRDELPSVSLAVITNYLVNTISYKGEKISKDEANEITKAIVDYGIVIHTGVRKIYAETVKNHFPRITEEEITKIFNKIIHEPRIPNILVEISKRAAKIDELLLKENKEKHDIYIQSIRNAQEIKDLPSIGMGVLNKKVLRACNDNDFYTNFKINDIKLISASLYKNNGFADSTENLIIILMKDLELNPEEKSLMFQQIAGSILQDETILYTINEIQEKENRIKTIMANNHIDTMEMIAEATRISQLPPNLTTSTLTNYIEGNMTLYPKDKRITALDLKNLTKLLLDGLTFSDEKVIKEIEKIATSKYPDKKDAIKVLTDKLTTLPRVFYLVEEINESNKRQTEFIGRNCSNVNVYLLPNNNSPIDGGRFYNCYINRVENLDLSEIIPLNLEDIVPQGMDIDSVEWYVQQNFDQTFKTAGGIILNKDEVIGNVTAFKPSDGLVGVTKEEKYRIKRLENLDEEVKLKEDKIQLLDTQIEQRQQKIEVLESEIEHRKAKKEMANEGMKSIISDYEKAVAELQQKMLSQIAELKTATLTIEDVPTEEESKEQTPERKLK